MVMEIKRQMFHAVKLIVGHDKELENIKFIRKRGKFILKLILSLFSVVITSLIILNE